MFVEGRRETPAMTTLELSFILQTRGIEKGSFILQNKNAFISILPENVAIPMNTLTESTSKHFAGFIIVTKPNLSTIVAFS